MKGAFIFLTCLLTFALAQGDVLSTGCGCGGGKKKQKNRHHLCQNTFIAGCGCGGKGGNPKPIPPDENS